MTQLKAYALASDHETCVRGLTAFRNARDLAEQHRDSFIQAANARASRGVIAAAAAQVGLDTTTGIQHDEDSTDELALSSPHYTAEIPHEEDSTDELAPIPSPFSLCR